MAHRIAAVARERLEPRFALFRIIRRRLAASQQTLLVAAAIFAALALFAHLSALWALAGFVVLGALLASQPAPGDTEDEEERSRDRALDEGRGGVPRDRNGESWRALVDAIPEAAVALDGSGNVMHHNALVLELFPKVRNGQPLSHMSRNPELNEAVDKAFDVSEPVVVQIFERVPVERRISATISQLATVRARRGLPALLLTFRDMTEQDRLAQMRADFVANASHELRTPLASLRGFVETLQGPARDDQEARQKFLAIMASQAARMTRLIDDLLSLSRVEMRVHLPPRGIADLNEVAAYVAQALEPLAAASKVTITVKKPDGPARIRGEREEIVQVLQNLVHNAIKYGREGGHVEVAVSRVMDGKPPAPRLLLVVADDGPGIAPEHLPRLTERFYRANVAASREKGGTGLGLAIVKHIIVRHRGELRIASKVGKGSTFSVLFEELGSARAA
jgi:two-component system phosphate regulon sensor histidine kinase PhoR